MIFIYANTRRELINLVAQHKFAGQKFDWISEQTIEERLRGFEFPVVVHCACIMPSTEVENLVRQRGGVILPLVCLDVTH